MTHLHAVVALMLFCYAANGQQNPEQILQQAILSHQSGQVERAISQYRAYLKLRPDSVDARSNLGVALAGTGRYTEAIVEYRAALKLRPQDPHIRLNAALAQYKLGDISEAASGSRRYTGSVPPTGRRYCCWPTAGCARGRTAR